MLSLKTIILKYPRACSSSLPAVCTVTEDQTNSKRRPFTSFFLFVFSSVFFCSCVLSLAASASPHAAPSCSRSREFMAVAALPSRVAGVYAAVRGSPIPRFGEFTPRSRLSHPAVRGEFSPPFAAQPSAVRGSCRRLSRLCHPPFCGISRRRLRIIQPSVPRG